MVDLKTPQESFSFMDDDAEEEAPPQRAVARRTDPDTSWEAAESLTSKAITQIQERIMAFFRRVIEATDERMIDVLRPYDYADSTLQTRRCELVRLGYLINSGKKAVNRRGRNMIVWKLA